MRFLEAASLAASNVSKHCHPVLFSKRVLAHSSSGPPIAQVSVSWIVNCPHMNFFSFTFC
jgi:hypothetical protein